MTCPSLKDCFSSRLPSTEQRMRQVWLPLPFLLQLSLQLPPGLMFGGGFSHGPVEFAGLSIEVALTELELDYPGIHPYAGFFTFDNFLCHGTKLPILVDAHNVGPSYLPHPSPQRVMQARGGIAPFPNFQASFFHFILGMKPLLVRFFRKNSWTRGRQPNS